MPVTLRFGDQGPEVALLARSGGARFGSTPTP